MKISTITSQYIDLNVPSGSDFSPLAYNFTSTSYVTVNNSVTIDGVNYTIVTISADTSSDTNGFNADSTTTSINVTTAGYIDRLLMVGGGGGGGQDTGSGGGGGAMLELQNIYVAAGSYNIRVGKGGNRATEAQGARGGDGGISECGFLPSNKVCYGGAGAASNNTGTRKWTPRDGGNGASGQSNQAGIGRNHLASGVVVDREQWFPFGNQAGAGSSTSTVGGGGGPGSPGRKIDGGEGRYTDITGSFVAYGGGGGGNQQESGTNEPDHPGGVGGGGTGGGDNTKHGSDGQGGGGGSYHGGWGVGGNGGTGVVILRIRE